jgi:3',5'-cyclic AMP phosphodiesterase CpdA
VPGNHDIPLYRFFERLWSPYELYRRYISPELDVSLTVGNVVIAGVNSTSPLTAITNGRITCAQLRFVAKVYKEAPTHLLRVLVAHHHFAPAPDFQRDETMPGAKKILEALEDLGVELILGGHLHRSYIGNALDVSPAARRSITIVLCGTTTSRRGRGREREKNSLNVVRVETHRIHVTHHMLITQGDFGFVPISEHVYPRSQFVSLV